LLKKARRICRSLPVPPAIALTLPAMRRCSIYSLPNVMLPISRPATPPLDGPVFGKAAAAAAAASTSAIAPPPPSTPIYAGSIESQLRAVLQSIDVDSCEANGENAFFVADLAEVYRQHVRWMRELPRVVPFYGEASPLVLRHGLLLNPLFSPAVKCNPDPYVLRLLAALGSGFDCASNGEIQSVLDLGVSPTRIIYANPCKASSFVRTAAAQGVGMATFDNADELTKMARFHPRCKLVVRILTDDSKSACQLGLKFGAPLDSVPRLLARAKELCLDVVGVSFHVGSGCYDPDSFRDAVLRARRAFDMGREAGFEFDLLDVGGGYAHDNFESIAAVLRPAIDAYFPDAEFAPGGSAVQHSAHGLRIIAEPGRYYVQKAFVLAANIIARRDGRKDDAEGVVEHSTAAPALPSAEDKPEVMYYQNDGMYGAFNCILFDHQSVHPKVLTLGHDFLYEPSLPAPGVRAAAPSASAAQRRALTLQPCSVWGPTCDSIDCVRALAHLPRGLEVSDWLVYEDMGAYTICAASGFNGLQQSQVRYTIGAEGRDADAVAALLGAPQY
jgi:ornithine decarboxylase